MNSDQLNTTQVVNEHERQELVILMNQNFINHFKVVKDWWDFICLIGLRKSGPIRGFHLDLVLVGACKVWSLPNSRLCGSGAQTSQFMAAANHNAFWKVSIDANYALWSLSVWYLIWGPCVLFDINPIFARGDQVSCLQRWLHESALYVYHEHHNIRHHGNLIYSMSKFRLKIVSAVTIISI